MVLTTVSLILFVFLAISTVFDCARELVEMSKSRLPVLERDRLEMLGERMDVSTNELVHVDLIKAFCSRDSVRGAFYVLLLWWCSSFCIVSVFFLELVLPSAINRLSAQKSFLSRLCEEAGVTASRDRLFLYISRNCMAC